MQTKELDSHDRELVEAAIDVIRRNYQDQRHTVGAAVLSSSGKIFSAVNLDSCGYGPCAEPIALGAAISNGETSFHTIVAVSGTGNYYPVLPPCGNCRQLLLDYAHGIMVVLSIEDRLLKVDLENLLPFAYEKRTP